MINGISHEFSDRGVRINIPTAYKEFMIEDITQDKYDLGKYISRKPDFEVGRIVFDLNIGKGDKAGENPNPCVPALFKVQIKNSDIMVDREEHESHTEFVERGISELLLADWDEFNWNRMTIGLERWMYPNPSQGPDDYIGYVTGITCLPGDPPIAVGR